MSIIQWLDNKVYRRFDRNWDDALLRERILALASPTAMALDLGAGAGIVEHMDFRGSFRRVCGVDLDPRVISNPFLDEGRVADAGRIPYEDATFDVVYSDNVLEHLPEPLVVFAEVARVLRPGGSFVFKTPNKWHYMPTIARLTPYRFHRWINRKRGRSEADTFPTRYRANTRGTLEHLAHRSGLKVVSIERLEGRPEYLRMSAPTYLAGFLYERLVNSARVFEPFRILLVGHLRRVP